MYSIKSTNNVLFKHLQKLYLFSKVRHEYNEAIITGENNILQAIEAGKLTSLFLDEITISKYNKIINTTNCRIYTIPNKMINKLKFDGYYDIFGICKFVNKSLEDAMYEEDCIILESIQDPGNLGTIIRSASAAGIKHVVLSANSVDLYNPKVIKASQGCIFKINIYIKIDLLSFIKQYKKNIYATVVLNGTNIFDLNLKSPNAWIFGNEGSGINQNIMQGILKKVMIPMLNHTESLNVAMSATICMFEQLRQRVV